MKTVTIPTCANPFVVIVNGIKYTYPAGATVEVPDDVAAVIEQHDEAHNKPAPAPVQPPFASAPSSGGSGTGGGGGASGGGGLPVVELTTVVTTEGVTLTAEEGSALDAVAATGLPFVMKITTIDGALISGIPFKVAAPDYGTTAFYMPTLDKYIMCLKQDGVWLIMDVV